MLITLSATSNTAMASLMTLHAKHIFDFDATRSSQYFYVEKASTTTIPILTLFNYMINQTVSESEAILAPFLTAAQALPGITLLSTNYTYELINDILYQPDDTVAVNLAFGSRFIPETTYSDSPEVVGQVRSLFSSLF